MNWLLDHAGLKEVATIYMVVAFGWAQMLERMQRHMAASSPACYRSGDLMAVDVVTEIVIDRPVEVVAEYVADPSNASEWYVNIESVHWRTAPPVTVGSRMDFVARFLGRRLAYTYEVVELVPMEQLVMRTAQGPFPMETSYQWASSGDRSTHMSLRNRGEPSGFAGVAAPLMSVAMRRANQKDLARLKSLLESR